LVVRGLSCAAISCARQGYTTITCGDHDSFGLDEEDADRFRTNRRWHLVTGFVESAGFYQLPDSDKALHGDIPRVASGPDGRSGIRLPQAMAGLITPSSPA